jgi:hypothetical protein
MWERDTRREKKYSRYWYLSYRWNIFLIIIMQYLSINFLSPPKIFFLYYNTQRISKLSKSDGIEMYEFSPVRLAWHIFIYFFSFWLKRHDTSDRFLQWKGAISYSTKGSFRLHKLHFTTTSWGCMNQTVHGLFIVPHVSPFLLHGKRERINLSSHICWLLASL